MVDSRKLVCLLFLSSAGLGSACAKRPPEVLSSHDGGDTASAAATAKPILHNIDPRLLVTDGAIPPAMKSDPGWDLDPDDPPRDYLERYIQVTRRYGADTKCVHAAPSRTEDGKTIVLARDTKEEVDPRCKGTDAVRDAFTVDVAKDRLALIGRGAPLGKWPDGSEPGESPKAEAKEEDVKSFRPALMKVFHSVDLSPVRLEMYGRSSYPVITVAGWHEPLTEDASPGTLTFFAESLCTANGGMPLGVYVGVAREKILRVRCPGSVRWQATQ